MEIVGALGGIYGYSAPYSDDALASREKWRAITYLGDAEVCSFWSESFKLGFSGRRLRVLANLIKGGLLYEDSPQTLTSREVPKPIVDGLNRCLTYTELWRSVSAGKNSSFEYVKHVFGSLDIATGGAVNERVTTEIDPEYAFGDYTRSNPEVHYALQDLGHTFAWDMHLAVQAFDNPDIFYPGLDKRIEPVSNEHVELVIWALQRELSRERRVVRGTGERRDYAHLDKLPFRIQRALVERRRLRYQQWGITPQSWETGKWSLFDVDEGIDWAPPWDITLS